MVRLSRFFVLDIFKSETISLKYFKTAHSLIQRVKHSFFLKNIVSLELENDFHCVHTINVYFMYIIEKVVVRLTKIIVLNLE